MTTTFTARARARRRAELERRIAADVQATRHPGPWGPDDVGRVVARRHPTGWFVSARCRADLDDEHRAMFEEFARVRVQSLLADGPTASAWLPGDEDGVFETFSTSRRTTVLTERIAHQLGR